MSLSQEDRNVIMVHLFLEYDKRYIIIILSIKKIYIIIFIYEES